MKKLLYTTLALSALLAGHASALTYNQGSQKFPANPAVSTTTTFGGDGGGTYYISGTAGSFCELDQTGTNAGDSGNNVTIASDVSEPPYGFGRGIISDAVITINTLQDGNDHAAPWSATISMPNSVCNSAYTVSVEAQGGGLVNTTAAPAGFTNLLPYTIAVSFAGTNKGPLVSTATTTLTPIITSGTAYAGPLTITLSGSASTAYLLYGTYAGVVVMNLSPTI